MVYGLDIWFCSDIAVRSLISLKQMLDVLRIVVVSHHRLKYQLTNLANYMGLNTLFDYLQTDKRLEV